MKKASTWKHMGHPGMKIYTHFLVFFFGIVICSFLAIATAQTAPVDMASAILIRVDQSGRGDFKTIQDAIDAVPSGNTEQIFIRVKPGTYREKIVVPADKPFITLSGTKASNTIITWNEGGDILESATLTVLASDFVGRLLTIQNTFGTYDKAVALRVSADRAAFYRCRILSYQDTLLDDTGNHYYRNCYIEGATDFICGSASSLYENCHLHSVSERSGSITAQKRVSPTENSGFTFLGCKVTGSGSAVLGRPWGPYSRVVFALTYISSAIVPQGWDVWRNATHHSTAYYGEYKCYGPGADRSGRVEWSRSLSDDEAAAFLSKNMIGGRAWLRPVPTHFRRSSSMIRSRA